MKKKIIILTSIFVFLSLVGGGIAAYYFSYLPMKKETEEKFWQISENYVNEYYDLLEQNKFIEAQKLLTKYRSFVCKKKSDKRLLAYFYSLLLENSLWYMQKDYEKMKVNFPEMEQLLKKIEKSKLSEDKILTAKWNFISIVCDFAHKNNEYKRALKLIKEFINENGGENKLKEKSFSNVHLIYNDIADCYKGLDKKDQAIKYYKKAIEATDDKRFQHLFYVKLAEIYDPEKDFDKPLRYLLQAQEKDESQKCYYYLAVLYLKHGNKEVAKKYYFLSAGCKRFPRIEKTEENLEQLKKMLFD